MNITLQPRRFARRTDHISRGTITKDVPWPRYMEKGITPPTHPLRSLATLLPFDGCGPHSGRGSTSGPFQALRLTLRPFPGPSSRPLTAPLGLFRGVLLADAKHPLAHAKLRLSGCPWRIVSQACKTGHETTLLVFNAHPAGRFRPCWPVWFIRSTKRQPRRQGPMTVQHNNQHREPPR